MLLSFGARVSNFAKRLKTVSRRGREGHGSFSAGIFGGRKTGAKHGGKPVA